MRKELRNKNKVSQEYKDKGYITVGELCKLVKDKYNKNVSSNRIYQLSKDIVKLSRKSVYIGDWEKVLDILSESSYELRKKTNLERYGVENPSQNKQIVEKQKNTVKSKHMNCETLNSLSKHFNKEWYGIEKILEYLDIKPKSIENRIRYYDNSVIKLIDEFYKEHYRTHDFFYKNTCLEKYGVENVSQSETIKEKKKQTLMKHYGVDNFSKLESSRKRISDIAKNNAKTRKETKLKTINKLISDFEKENDCISLVHLNEKYHFGYDKYGRFSEVIHRIGIDYLVFEKNIFIYNKDINKIIEYKEICHDHLTSYFENEVCSFIKSIYNEEIVENNRKIISPKELDIYIPSKNVAIECDGLYWHSNEIKDDDYHLNKTLACEEKGIRLIHIFEDEWIFKKDICKSIIASSLGIYDKRIFARECMVSEIDSKTSRNFLNENHIQGSVNSSKNFGLFYNNKLVQVVSFGKLRFKKNEVELLRMSTKLNTQVVGGFSKLISFALDYMKINNFISYIDRRLFNGKGYKSCGFKKIGESKPSYFYIMGAKRENRLKYHKHKLSKLLKNYNSELTEKENMMNNGYKCIYDCGTIKVIYKK